MPRFCIDAIHDPQSLPRIAGFFAQRAIIPSEMRMELHEDHLRIDVTLAAMEPVRATAISAQIAEMFAVIGVLLDGEIMA